MAITKTTTKSIKDASVEEANINNCAATNTKLGADAVTSAKINNGTVTADDLASTLDLSSKTVTLPSSAISFDREYNNIGLLGFKMAVNESLTVFNLVDGVVDEFNDESGTDEAEGSNDNYCGTDDYYANSSSFCISAGFSTTTITEPDTSTAGTNPAYSLGTAGEYTVPADITSITAFTWGAGGGGSGRASAAMGGGGGGFATGNIAVTPGQSFDIYVGEGGNSRELDGNPYASAPAKFAFYGGGSSTNAGEDSATGGGLTAIMSCGTSLNPKPDSITPANNPTALIPQIYMVAGSGGGGGGHNPPSPTVPYPGTWGGSYINAGAGGGTTGDAAGQSTAQTAANNSGVPQNFGNFNGGGGDQEQGGQGGAPGAPPSAPQYWQGDPGHFLEGGAIKGEPDTTPSPFGPGDSNMGSGGAGFYGGGSGGYYSLPQSGVRSGGGGSSYIGNPGITCGSTTSGTFAEGGGVSNPNYVSVTNEGIGQNGAPDFPVPENTKAEDGYVLITASGCLAVSSTIVSTAFTSTDVPTTARIVVFEENIDTPTLNTDIIASVSRDGTNFTNATLSDSGYVTGSSGQRILTGQADISGQPSGQSMRWKLQLANNQVKIHGVSLSWA